MSERIWVAHGWRKYWIMMGLLALEVPITIGLLIMFGIADNNTYRTKLWQNGYDEGFNSSPSSILYDYANHRPVHIPLVWSNFVTEYNIVISVLSMFVLLVKSVMYMLHVFIPLFSVLIHAVLVAVYAVSVHIQATPDNSDSALPSPGGMPWYLSKGCTYATPSNWSYCMQARAAFGLTCVMLALFVICLVWSAYNLIPMESEKQERLGDRKVAIELKTSVYDPDDDKTKKRRSNQSRGGIPKTPTTAVSMKNLMTPRTQAFSVLNGGGTGEASAIGRRPNGSNTTDRKKPAVQISTGVGPSRPLAFREQYSESSSTKQS